MTNNLAGKVALVTGGNRGIGKGCVLELARRGADVLVNCRLHLDEAEEVAAEVRALGRRAVTHCGSVAERALCRDAVGLAVKSLGRIDIVVANAAHSVRKPCLELEEDDMYATLATTLMGAFHVAQLGAREMVRQGGGGAIVMISSVHAVLAMPGSLPYNAAKAGLNHMARTMAAELAGQQIRVNIVEPGWTDTPGERKFVSEEEIAAGARRLPMGRLARIEDIAAGVAYLAGPEATYVTGATLRIDGGFVLPRA